MTRINDARQEDQCSRALDWRRPVGAASAPATSYSPVSRGLLPSNHLARVSCLRRADRLVTGGPWYARINLESDAFDPRSLAARRVRSSTVGNTDLTGCCYALRGANRVTVAAVRARTWPRHELWHRHTETQFPVRIGCVASRGPSVESYRGLPFPCDDVYKARQQMRYPPPIVLPVSRQQSPRDLCNLTALLRHRDLSHFSSPAQWKR